MTDFIPVQKYAVVIGDAGCYFSCIIKAAEILRHNNIDLIRTFDYCSKQKADKKLWIEPDTSFIWHPQKILSYLIKKNVSVKKVEDLNYKPKENEIMIGLFEYTNSKTKKTYQHFGNLDENKNCIYDPLGDSNTIKFGKLISLRVFTIDE